MNVLIIQNCQTEGIGLYLEYLQDNNIDHTIFEAFKNEEFPGANYDGYIVGGTPISVNDLWNYPFLRKEWDYLKKVIDKHSPCLGICFGGQLLSKLLGAKVRVNLIPEIGGYSVQLTDYGKNDRLFKGFPETFPVFHWHQDTFTLPSKSVLLVEGTLCKNQAFRYRTMVALQFHLEITSKDAQIWAEKYQDELQKVHKTKKQVITECKEREKEMRKLSYRLLDNFFEMLSQNE